MLLHNLQTECLLCVRIAATMLLIEEWKIASLKEISSQMSSTSLQQQWDKPRGEEVKLEAVSETLIARPTNFAGKKKPIVVHT